MRRVGKVGLVTYIDDYVELQTDSKAYNFA
jgi:hypothetical protein